MAAMDQATPMPRKTFTALLPVTFPMEASAYWSCVAATLLANVSAKGRWRKTLRKQADKEGQHQARLVDNCQWHYLGNEDSG